MGGGPGIRAQGVQGGHGTWGNKEKNPITISIGRYGERPGARGVHFAGHLVGEGKLEISSDLTAK